MKQRLLLLFLQFLFWHLEGCAPPGFVPSQDPDIDMSSTESSDSEGSLPDVAPINVYGVLPKVMKLESSKKKKMVSIGAFTFYFGYMTTVHIEEAPEQLNKRNACVYYCSKRQSLVVILEVMHSVEHKTCWFHFVQALMKHLKELSLLEAYYNSVPFYLFIWKLCCLALIDPDFIASAFNCLKQEATSFLEEEWYQNVDPFMQYFESTWVQRRNCRGQLVEGRIPKQYWNHHDAATAGRATTTSSLEGWNRRTTEAAAKYPKMSIWYFLHHFKNEIGKESHQRIVRLSQGVGLVETSTAAQKRKIECIKEALVVFNEEDMGNSMARMSNAIDGIELVELDFDGV